MQHRNRRLEDFEERAAFDPESVYTHTVHGWRYIPVHFFAGEREGHEAVRADAWVSLEGEVALLECCGARAGSLLSPGLYFRIDEEMPHFRKLFVVLEENEVSREMAEAAMSRFVELGFPDAPLFHPAPGGNSAPVDRK